MLKELKRDNVQIAPFIVSKNWVTSNFINDDLLLTEAGESIIVEYVDFGTGYPQPNRTILLALEQQPKDKISYQVGQKDTARFFLANSQPKNEDGTYKTVVYAQIATMFYNKYKDPTKVWGLEHIDFELSGIKKFLTDEIRVFTVPRNVFGEKIVENSIYLTDNAIDNPYSVTDDGKGNLFAGYNLFSKVQEVRSFRNTILDNEFDMYCDDYLTFTGPSGSVLLNATKIHSKSAFTNWNDPFSGLVRHEDGWVLERTLSTGSPSNLTWSILASLPENSTQSYDNTVTGSLSSIYTYRVYAWNAFGSSSDSYSNTASVIYTPPNAQSGLTGTILATSPYYVRLAWTDNADDEMGQIIERSINTGSSWVTQSYTASINQTSYSDITVTGSLSSTYWWRLRAYNDFGKSNYSDTASVYFSPPTTSLTANDFSLHDVELTWVDHLYEKNNIVERSINSGSSWVVLNTFGADVTTDVDSTCTASVSNTYWYRIQLLSDFGSGYSNSSTISFSPPTAPGMAAAKYSLTASTLTLTDNSVSESGFVIERSEGGTGSWAIITYLGPNVATYRDDTVTGSLNSVYSYKAQSYHEYGSSSYSNTSTITYLPPDTPTQFSGTYLNSSASLTWTDVAPLSGDQEEHYIIEFNSASITDPFNRVGTTDPDVTTFVHEISPAPSTGMSLNYKLRAVNQYGESNTGSLTIIIPLTDSSGSAYLLGPWEDFESYASGSIPANGGYGWASAWQIRVPTITDFNFLLPAEDNFSSYSDGDAHGMSGGWGWPNASSTVRGPISGTVEALGAGRYGVETASLAWSSSGATPSGLINQSTFYIYRSTDLGIIWDWIGSSSFDSQYFYDTNVTTSVTYSYKVQAWNPISYTAYSNTASIGFPEIPVISPESHDMLAWFRADDINAGQDDVIGSGSAIWSSSMSDGDYLPYASGSATSAPTSLPQLRLNKIGTHASVDFTPNDWLQIYTSSLDFATNSNRSYAVAIVNQAAAVGQMLNVDGVTQTGNYQMKYIADNYSLYANPPNITVTSETFSGSLSTNKSASIVWYVLDDTGTVTIYENRGQIKAKNAVWGYNGMGKFNAIGQGGGGSFWTGSIAEICVWTASFTQQDVYNMWDGYFNTRYTASAPPNVSGFGYRVLIAGDVPPTGSYVQGT